MGRTDLIPELKMGMAVQPAPFPKTAAAFSGCLILILWVNWCVDCVKIFTH